MGAIFLNFSLVMFIKTNLILINMDNDQKLLIENIDEPLLIFAGSGCAKTHLILEKIKYLHFEKKIDFEKILLLSFLDDFNKDIKRKLFEISKGKVISKNFYSFALELIEENLNLFDLYGNFKIIAEMEFLLFFHEKFSNQEFLSDMLPKDFEEKANLFAKAIFKLKKFNYPLNNIEKINLADINLKIDLINVYSSYEKYKKEKNFLDNGDLLFLIRNKLKNDKNFLKIVLEKYSYILVDDFQEINLVQMEIFSLFAKNNFSVFCDIINDENLLLENHSNILKNFKNHFKNLKILNLNKNYRSSNSIINFLNDLSLNMWNEDKFLLVKSKDSNNSKESNFSFVKSYSCEDDKTQIIFIMEKIREILSVSDKNIAILCRTENECEKISNLFDLYAFDYENCFSYKIFKNPFIKDILSILKIIKNPKISSKEFFHILSISLLNEDLLYSLSRKASFEKKPLYDLCLSEDIDFGDDKEIVSDILKKIETGRELFLAKFNILKIVKYIVSSFNLYEKAIVSENKTAIISMNIFFNFILRFEKLNSSLDFNSFFKICKLSKNSSFSNEYEGNMKVKLMTINQAKGAEFDIVFLAYLNDKIFPLNKKNDLLFFDFDLNPDLLLLEEKKLFYLAVSRAKESLFLSYVKKMSENNFEIKASSFYDYINIETKTYSNDISKFDINLREGIKFDIIKKINSLLIEMKFDLAKKEIDILKNIFGKKDLSFYLNKKLETDIETYKKSLNGFGFENLQIDFSSAIYSVSQLQMYKACPRKYLYSYIYKIPSVSRHYFDFGTSIHAVLEDIAPILINEKDKDILYAKAIALLKKKWISKAYENFEQEKDYFEKGIEAIRFFIENHFELMRDGRKILSTEKKFLIEINGKKLMGVIDRIDELKNGDYEIIDYKTSNTMEKTYSLGKNLQLLLYSYALKNDLGKFPKKIGLWYLIHNKLNLVFFNEKNLDDAKVEISKLIENIEKKIFIANPNSFNCKFCDYNDLCPYSKEKSL